MVQPLLDKLPRVALLLLLLSGCSSVPGQAPWGSNVTWTPGWQRLGQASLQAACDPLTWVPAAGAAVFAIGDLDENLSDWAVDHTPLFGSHADDTSDYLRDSLLLIYLGSSLASDGDLPRDQWLNSKMQGFGIGLSAELATYGLTMGLKQATNRTRPDRRDQESFPSGHSSIAAERATLVARTSDSLPLTAPQRTLVKAGSYTLAAGTAWARVEAERHYPSDVLAGLALGHFVATVVQKSFLPDTRQTAAMDLDLGRERVLVSLRLAF